MERGELVLSGILVLALGAGAAWNGYRSQSSRVTPVIVDGEPGTPGSGSSDRGGGPDQRPTRPPGIGSGDSWKRDINTATAAELAEANGIGDVLSQEIVRYRETHGPFRKMEDLLDVPGIGASRLANLRELFDVRGTGNDPPDQNPPSSDPAPLPPIQRPLMPDNGEAPALPVPPDPRDTRIDLNSASESLLMEVPGIGPAFAERIVRYRETHGPFRSVGDLVNVSGIGEKRLQAFEPYLRVGPAPDPGTGQGGWSPGWVPEPPGENLPPLPRGPGSLWNAPDPAEPPAQPGSGRIDINRASKKELTTLPGIGEVLAGRIIEERERGGPFRSPADIQRVRGIGPKTFENIRDRITAGP